MDEGRQLLDSGSRGADHADGASAETRARFATASVLARTEISRSDGPASGASAGHIPASASIDRPGGVPMTTATSATPASCLACSATRMRSIESKYEFRRTAHTKRIPGLQSSHYRVRSSKADHHEAPLLEVVVNIPSFPVARTARAPRRDARRQDAPVEEDLDIRHPGEDLLEVIEQLDAVPGDDDDHPRHRSSPSENLPSWSLGHFSCPERAKHFKAFSNGIAHAADSIFGGKNDLPCTVSTDNRQANGPPSLSRLPPRDPPARVSSRAIPRRRERRGDPRPAMCGAEATIPRSWSGGGSSTIR